MASESIDHFQQGDYQLALTKLDQAIQLAPDVPAYHGSKASVYAAYLQTSRVPPDPECSLELNGTPYQVCLVQNVYIANLQGVEQRPFYWRSRLALANSALALGLEGEAVRLYREVISMAPASWPLYNRLAEAYIDIDQPESALEVLKDSLAITQETPRSDQARGLQLLAKQKLGATEVPAPIPEVY